MATPKVSVIIPTYKRRDLVLDTLASVFAQTFTDYEVIVVNDGSPDDTAEVMQPLAYAGKIRYVEQPNAGMSAARNRGLAEARGEYLAFLDDDDLWSPDKLEWQVQALDENPDVVLVYGFPVIFGEGTETTAVDGPQPSGAVHEDYLRRNHIYSIGQTLLRADAVREIAGFDVSIAGVEDWEMYIRLAERGNFLYQRLESLRYRQQAGSISKNGWMMYQNGLKLRGRHLGLRNSSKEKKLWKESGDFIAGMLISNTIQNALNSMGKRDWRQSRREWSLALRLRPRALTNRALLVRCGISFLPDRAASFCFDALSALSSQRKGF